MSFKKKLGLGVASAALGLSLVGGGTFAAFNDTATINNHFASGTLDLEVGKNSGKDISFDLGNMKPGDSVQRIFRLNNAGTLAIKEVLLDVTAENFIDGNKENGDSTAGQYLSQFVINFARVDGESNDWQPSEYIVEGELTLFDLVNNDLSAIDSDYISDGRINLASIVDGDRKGIPLEDTDDVFIEIEFKDDEQKVDGEYLQNKFQGDSIDFFFNLEATQWDGVHVDTNHRNGEINNGVQGSADGESMPDPRTKGEATHDEEVTD